MKRIVEKMDAALLRVKLAAMRFAKEERGDTNFLSIAIILVVVLGLAIVFIGFGKTLTTGLKNAIQELKDALGI
jgi:hypothetical protein